MSYTISMTPLQFRQLLARANLSQSQAARLLDISDRTMRRYVAGPGRVPTIVVRAVLHLINEQEAK